jgi:hypothetical protein
MLVLKLHPSRREWLHTFITEQMQALALVGGSMTHQAFVDFIVPLMPRGGAARDQRKFMVVRALKRMLELGTLPCRIEGDRFVF